VCITVDDAREHRSFDIAVSGADALDAFHHPYAYAPRGVV
jgi:hypothetical protein